MGWSGVIFDLNGVLWWDGPLQEESWALTAVALRGTPLAAEEMALQVHGRNNRHTLEYLLSRPLSEQELAQRIEDKEAIYRRLCLAQGAGFALSPGAGELLDWMVARGVPRTIATASGRGNVDFFVEHLALHRWFDVERIAYDDGILPGKPAPDLYRRAAANLGLPPGACVVIEDSLSGLAAAHAAGAGCIVALGPPPSHDALARLPGVRLVLTSLASLPAETLWPLPHPPGPDHD